MQVYFALRTGQLSNWLRSCNSQMRIESNGFNMIDKKNIYGFSILLPYSIKLNGQQIYFRLSIKWAS